MVKLIDQLVTWQVSRSSLYSGNMCQMRISIKIPYIYFILNYIFGSKYIDIYSTWVELVTGAITTILIQTIKPFIKFIISSIPKYTWTHRKATKEPLHL